MHEEDGQADVEQDDHADHDGVGTLEKTSVPSLRQLELNHVSLHQLETALIPTNAPTVFSVKSSLLCFIGHL